MRMPNFSARLESTLPSSIGIFTASTVQMPAAGKGGVFGDDFFGVTVTGLPQIVIFGASTRREKSTPPDMARSVLDAEDRLAQLHAIEVGEHFFFPRADQAA